MEFTTIRSASQISQGFASGSTTSHRVRDFFSLQTWLLIGACLQGFMLLLPVRAFYILLPTLLALIFKGTMHVFMALGFMENLYMKGVIPDKYTGMFPSSDFMQHTPEHQTVTVLLLTTRNNHPLGPLAPGFNEINERFRDMMLDLETNAASNGFLGGSSYINTSQRSNNSEFMSVFYFRSAENVHAFAHGPIHLKAWLWWNKEIAKGGLKHLSIGHEVYEAPKEKWETVYAGSEPSGFAAVTVPLVNNQGRMEWMSTIFDASTEKLMTHKGRMGLSDGNDNATQELKV